MNMCINIDKTKEWISKFEKMEDMTYTFDNFKYESYSEKVNITCPIHGDFNVTINNFYNKNHRCGKCSGRGFTNIERINMCNDKHNGIYTYDKFDYINAHELTIITCPLHGDFKKRYNEHINGSGCNKCKGYGLDVHEHIEIFNEVHNNRYDYSKFKYNGMNANSTIICETHGEFEQTPTTHRKSGCGKCVGKGLSDSEHIEIFNEVHNNTYDYSKFKYNDAITNSIIICKEHGDFLQSPNKHKEGQGCPRCKLSKGAIKILHYLDNNNIEYTIEEKFNGCKHKRRLPFDFYLQKFNICIEYDGRQHFEPVSFGSTKSVDEKFESTKRNDTIKTKFCKDNNIKLIRIPYTEFKNIDTILEKELNIKNVRR